MRVDALLANRFADGHPIDVRQHQIEDDEVEWFGERTHKAFASVADGFAVVSDASKLLGYQLTNALLVLDKDLRVLAASRSFYLTYSRSPGPTPKAGCFTPSAMVNGTFRGFACSWKKSCRSTA